ncbi:odorant receptor 30a [Dendroctonus ponderosae]|nr:odorant receptor 30a [Dendroctonus ponderosae]
MGNDFFGVCIPLAKAFCIMPDLAPSTSRKSLLDKIYAFLIYFLVLFCHITELFKLYQIVTAEYFILDEFIRNYTVTSFHFTTIFKIVFIKGEISKRAFREIMEFEDAIYKSLNDDIHQLYKACIIPVQNSRKYYLAGFVLVVAFYLAAPLFRDPIQIQKDNESIRIRQVPLSSWSPVEEHYWYAFVWTGLTGSYLTIFFVTTDLICFSFIAFGTCRIEILRHYIRNFNQYCRNIMLTHGYSREDSARILQKKIIIYHQDIISYVKMINGSLKNLMLLDFLPGSLQLAGLIFQLMKNLNYIQCILLGEFICSLIARVFIYAHNAHNLSQISQQLADDWFEIDWNDLPKGVKTNLHICIMRSQKSLCITVGDLDVITMKTFLVILKGTYSYLTLLMTI